MEIKIKNLIETMVSREIKNILSEKLRGGFNLSDFKKINDREKCEAYAMKYLGKPLGAGSSRMVWALSGNKVLKMDKGVDGAGFAQNKAEVDLWTNPKTKPIITRIYDFHPGYMWLISEVAKPYENLIEFSKKFNMTPDFFEEFLNYAFENELDFEQAYSGFISKLKVSISRSKDKLANSNDAGAIYNLKNRIQEANEQLEEIQKSKIHLFKKIIDGVNEMRKTTPLIIDDIMRSDHYGQTADGRLVIIDYGFDEEVFRKFYY